MRGSGLRRYVPATAGLTVMVALVTAGVFTAGEADDRRETRVDAAVARGGDPGPNVRELIHRSLSDLDGRRLRATLVEVTYAGGERSLPHRHRCAVTGYVVRGALRFQMAGRDEVVHRVGEAFAENPGDAHLVSANASPTEPVTFVAYFVCDDAGPRTVNLPRPPAIRP